MKKKFGPFSHGKIQQQVPISRLREQGSRGSKLFAPRPDLFACKLTRYVHLEEPGLPRDF